MSRYPPRVFAASAMALVLGVVSAQPESIPVHSSAKGGQVDPSLVLTSDGLVIAYVDQQADRAEVLYVHTPDLATFSAPVPLSGSAAGSDEVIRPHLATNGNRVVATWASAAGGDHDLYVAISDDGGRVFSAPIVAVGGDGGQLDPRATVLADGTIFIVFHNSAGSTGEDNGVLWRISMVQSSDGQTFGPPIFLPDANPSGERFDRSPDIAGLGTALTVVWLRNVLNGERELRLIQSSDGVQFDADRRLDGGKHPPRIASTASGFVVVTDRFVEKTGQVPAEVVINESSYLEVMAMTSTDATTFSSAKRINETRTFHQMKAEVAADGDQVVVVWLDHSSPGRRRIMICRSTDGGRTFGAESVVSDNDDYAEVQHPRVDVRGNTVAVVWEDERGGTFDVRAAILD